MRMHQLKKFPAKKFCTGTSNCQPAVLELRSKLFVKFAGTAPVVEELSRILLALFDKLPKIIGEVMPQKFKQKLFVKNENLFFNGVPTSKNFELRKYLRVLGEVTYQPKRELKA